MSIGASKEKKNALSAKPKTNFSQSVGGEQFSSHQFGKLIEADEASSPTKLV